MIVGLSNPKKEYYNTRHNAGSWYVHDMARRFLTPLIEEKKFFGFTAVINLEFYKIRLFIPNIFMNVNGQSVLKIASFYSINLDEILIVHDDLDIQPGIVKLKYGYGHNGHNGLRNIIALFNKKINFYRFRIGIGRPINKDHVSSFVLSSPTSEEKMLIMESISHAVEKTLILINKNRDCV